MTTRSRLQTIIPIGLIVVLAVIVTNVFPFRQMIAQDRTVELARMQLADLEADNADLESQVSALMTETELERIARQDLGYVREGEIAYVITTPSDYVPETIDVPTLPEVRPWWKAVVDFLTGEDLVTK